MSIRIFVVLLLALNAAPRLAHAEGFADGFKAFVLGDEAAARASTLSRGLDAVSQACVQCHDSMRHAGGIATGAIRTHSHPVGVNYDHYAFTRPQDYRPRTSLPGTIRLVDGQVGCASCHKLKNAEPQAALGGLPAEEGGCRATREFATGGNRDRALCLACHIK